MARPLSNVRSPRVLSPRSPRDVFRGDERTVHPRFVHTEYPRNGLRELLKTGNNSDVTFVVEGKELRAHRIIVASQCNYFDSLLFGGMREAGSNKIHLEDTPWQAFQHLLEYMYTGQVGELQYQACIDLMVLADRYNFVRLHKDLEWLLCEVVSISNVLQLMFYADSCNARRLYAHCTSVIDHDAETLLASKALLDLPIEYMKKLVSRDTFVVSEVKIVEAVKRWREYNEFTVEEIGGVLESIRLSEMSSRDIKEVVGPSGLYSDKYLDTVVCRRKQEDKCPLPRGHYTPNLFDHHCEIEVSNFEVRGGLLPVELDFKLRVDAPSPHTQSTITFMFDDPFLINHLAFEGVSENQSDGDEQQELRNPFLYIVNVSTDNRSWVTVIDHSICKCYYNQDLYFPRVVARSLQVKITKSRADLNLSFKACTAVPDVAEHFIFYEGGSIAPVMKLSPKCMIHWVQKQDKKCIVTFHQPYHITKIRIKGTETHPDYLAQVRVKVALYNRSRFFTTVEDGHRSLTEDIEVTFKEQLVSLVIISIPCYFNSKTGENLSNLLEKTKLEITNFSVKYDS